MTEEKIIEKYLTNLNLDQLDTEARMIKVVRAVSEIPWGEGRSIEEVFERGVGTCTGKHKVLQGCFDQLGIKYKPVVCTFKWGEQGITLPNELREILAEGEWEHGHNFLKLENGNYVDITWDSPLKKAGFKTLPDGWTPDQTFIGLQKIQQQWDDVSIDEMKGQLINSLDGPTKERRERFLHALIKWIDSIHDQNK